MIDRERQIESLKTAERHIAQGRQHIADQERRVDKLRRDGQDVTQASSLLRLFREVQVQHIAHRDLLLGELER